jgi:hypothetical protein
MKFFVSTALFTTSGMAMALGVLAGSVEGLVYAQSAQALGASTPISGITIGLLIAAAGASGAMLWRGAKSLLELGAYLGQLKYTINASAKNVRAVTERLSNMEDWRVEVDPIIRGIEGIAGD